LELFRFLCAALQIANAGFGMTETPYDVTPSSVATPIRHVAAADGETLVVEFGFVPGRNRTYYRQLATVTEEEGREPVRIEIPFTHVSNFAAAVRGSDGLTVTGDGWWYTTFDERDGAAATTFVRSGGARTTHPRPRTGKPLIGGVHWYLLALAGEEPGALELTYGYEETIIRELDWKGAVRTWNLPAVPLIIPRPTMTAERLPDGRIALFSIGDGLSMMLLSDEGAIEEKVLRNVRITQFDTAIDGAGRIAVVTARKDGLIDAAIVDAGNAGSEEWQVLRRNAQVMGTMRELQVVKAANGFVAAWIDVAGRRIEATEIGDAGTGGPVVDVGPASPRDVPAFFAVQAVEDELRFWWEDGEHLYERRLPAALSAFAVEQEFSRLVCGTAEAEIPNDAATE
jgi:hypothetical protein